MFPTRVRVRVYIIRVHENNKFYKFCVKTVDNAAAYG